MTLSPAVKAFCPGNTILILGPWLSGPAIPLELLEELDELEELEVEELLELLGTAAGAVFLFLFPPQPVSERLMSVARRRGLRDVENIEWSSVSEIKKPLIVEGWLYEGQPIPN